MVLLTLYHGLNVRFQQINHNGLLNTNIIGDTPVVEWEVLRYAKRNLVT